MASPIVILGWTSDDKTPGDYRETKYGAGRVSVGSAAVKVVLTGTKLSTGSMTADQDIEPVYGLDDAARLAGAGSTAYLQAKAALNIPGVNLYLCPPATASTPTAASLTITFGGTWTAGGTVMFWLDGDYFEVNVGSTQVVGDAATECALQLNGLTDGPATASPASAVVTVTARNTGTQGNSHRLAWDMSQAPTGLTVTVAGGTALHDRLVPFSGGVGTESLATVLGLLKTDVFDYIAVAQIDATNLGLVEAHMASEAGSTICHLEHAITASTGTLVAATSLAQTTLNDARSCHVWSLNNEATPARIAATVAALRAVVEQTDPNYNFDNTPLPGIPVARYAADAPQHATLKAALNAGITPLYARNGTACIVRGITSKSLNGTAPDYSTLDWGDAIVPDRLSKELGAEWNNVFKPANPKVGPDSVGSEPAQPEGVGTPSNWNASVYVILKDFEQKLWLQDVDDNLPQTVYDPVRVALVSAIPCVVRKNQHSIGISVRQQAA